MSGGAYVGSVDALSDFRGAVHTFLREARDAMVTFDLELRRTLEWIDGEAQDQWAREVRKREDLVAKARIELEKKRSTKMPGGEPAPTIEERKALERVQRRTEFAQEKLKAMRRWSSVAQRAGIEYAGRSNQLNEMLDTQLPVAIAMLDRSLKALEAYAALQTQPSGQSSSGASTAGGSMASNDPPVKKSDDASNAMDAGAAALPQPLDETAPRSNP